MKKKNKGFTMVEALVAISILLIAVVGPLSLLATALRDSVYIRNEITANYLAQEGLEIITFFSDEISSGNYCVDATGDDYGDAVNSSSDCPIKYDGNYYGGNGENTIFNRVIEVERLRDEETMADDYDGSELRVTSRVSWQNQGFSVPKDISYTTYIFKK
ncbi:MAG TPA: prepilin-type N-terminal cleavage/methylation domain-containing protein [Candidatus Paceibacterota bacterium]|nr:prepilin-type N-terminal cleavage/methylation domain-containing protein [Candidatus Paceibacterota bacterium]HOG37637.1 prepilin-type N-terminal cleavage/methylation domain-containing protein [Candidatus Woesebacteria bacterium]